MNRWVWKGLLVFGLGCGAQVYGRTARADEVELHVTTPNADHAFRVHSTDADGHAGACDVDLRRPGVCQLRLSPGPLRLRVQSEGNTLNQTLTLDTDAELRLTHRSAAMGWIGVGLVGFAVLSSGALVGATVATAGNSAGSGGEVGVLGVLAVAELSLLITGGVLTAVGFASAGTKAELLAGAASGAHW